MLERGLIMINNYKASFIGREINAIGITYHIIETVSAENREKAILALYEKYDHISNLTIKCSKGDWYEIKPKRIIKRCKEKYQAQRNLFKQNLPKNMDG